MKIAIDYGGVCSSKAAEYEADPSDSKHNDTPRDITVPGCLEALNELAKTHELYLISFCGAKRAKQTRSFLESKYPELFKELYFTKKRTHKNAVCKLIGADIMIDDRLDILTTITDAHRIQFTGDYNDDEKKSNISDPKKLERYVADSWEAVLKLVDTLTPKGNVPDPDALTKNKVTCY